MRAVCIAGILPAGPAPFLRQPEVERRARAWRAFGAHAAAVPRDDALHRRQAHAAAFERLRALEPPEGLEQRAALRRIEADAVVAYQDLARRVAAHLDDGLLLPAGVLPGVAEQVLQHD